MRTPETKTILFDLHSGKSQMAVTNAAGEVLLEVVVRTTKKDLRGAVDGVRGPKRVICENGPMAALVRDAVGDVVEEFVAADPAHNALIALAENSCDEADALRLGVIDRAGGIRPVAIAKEPFRTLRSLLNHDRGVMRMVNMCKNRLKGLLHRHAIPCAGKSVYREAGRREIRKRLPNAQLRWQLDSQWRLLDTFRAERIAAHRQLGRLSRKTPTIRLLKEIPGVGSITAQTIVAWIMDPARFHSEGAISSYGGLGLGQGRTNWQPVGRTRASKRGSRALKRVLFLAARAATKGANMLAARYRARIAAGWKDDKVIRDVARKILFIACAMMRTGRHYDESLVTVPDTAR